MLATVWDRYISLITEQREKDLKRCEESLNRQESVSKDRRVSQQIEECLNRQESVSTDRIMS